MASSCRQRVIIKQLLRRNRKNPSLTDLKVIPVKFLRHFRLQSAKNKHFKKIRTSLLVLSKSISSAFGQERDKNDSCYEALFSLIFLQKPWRWHDKSPPIACCRQGTWMRMIFFHLAILAFIHNRISDFIR